jgi:hypothetical protein
MNWGRRGVSVLVEEKMGVVVEFRLPRLSMMILVREINCGVMANEEIRNRLELTSKGFQQVILYQITLYQIFKLYR